MRSKEYAVWLIRTPHANIILPRLSDWFGKVNGCCEMFSTTCFVETLGPVLSTWKEIYDEDDGLVLMRLARQHMNTVCLRRFQQLFVPTYLSFPICDRLQLARASVETQIESDDALVAVLPEVEAIDTTLASVSREGSCSLIHSLAEGLARSNMWKRSTGQQRYSDWITRCVLADAPSSTWLEGQESPWFRHIRVYCAGVLLRKPSHFPRFNEECRHWLRALRRAGINLQRYGKREEKVSRLCQWKQLEIPVEYKEGEEVKWVRLTGFTYGPQVEDWNLLWVVEYEHFAGDFWDMVESPRRYMPGSWVEDDEGCNDEDALDDGKDGQQRLWVTEKRPLAENKRLS